MLHLKMFGAIALTSVDGRNPKLSQRDLLLLCVVACSQRPVNRYSVIELFWPNTDPGKAKHSLSQCVYRINHRSGQSIVVTEAEAIGIAQDLLTTDYQLLKQDLRAGRLRKAANLLNGPFLTTAARDLPGNLMHWIDRKRRSAERQIRSVGIAECERLFAKSEWTRLKQLADNLMKTDASNDHARYYYCCSVVASNIHRGKAATLPARARRLPSGLASELERFAKEVQQGARAKVAALGESTYVERSGEQAEFYSTGGGRRRHCLILGPAGVGKTTFVKHILAVESAAGARVDYRRCAYSGRGFGYAPVIESVQAEWAEDALAHAPRTVQTVIGNWTKPRARSTFAEATSARSPLDWLLLIESISCLFDTAARDRPFLYCLDDIQWADMSTIGLLIRVAQRNRNPRVRIVLVGRTQELSRCRNTAAIMNEGSEWFSVINLRPFSPRAAAKLVRSIADERGARATKATVRTILAQSGGLPLFVRELSRSRFSADESSVGRGSDPAGSTTSVMDAYLLEALENTSRAGLRLLDVMAAHGGGATIDEWCSIAHLSSTDCLGVLAELVRRGVVEYTESAAYSITHESVRDALHRRMRPDYRRMLHCMIAENAAQRGRSSSIVAFHFNAGGQKYAAFRHAVRGATEAIRRHADLEAAGLYRIAADNSSTESTRLRLLARAAVCHIAARDMLPAREQLRALKGQLKHMDPRTCIEVQVQYAFVDARIADRTKEKRFASFQRLYEDPRVRRDARLKTLLLRAWVPLGAEMGRHGSLPPTEDFFSAIAALGDDPSAALALVDLGRSLCVLESAERALPVLDEALQLAARIDEPTSQLWALGAKASVLVLAGNLNDADELYGEYRSLADKLGLANIVLSYWNNRGMVYLEKGDYEQARSYLRKALTISKRAGTASLFSMAVENMHIWSWESGRIDALQDLDSGLELSKKSTYVPRCALAIRALAALEKGQLSEARRVADQLEKELRAVRISGDRAYIEMLIARVSIRLRRGGDPTLRLRNAIAESRPHNYLDALRMQLELAHITRRTDPKLSRETCQDVLARASHAGARLLEAKASELNARLSATT